jgi:hypothetical protein
LSATDETLGGAPHPAYSDRRRTRAEITPDASSGSNSSKKSDPQLIGLARLAPVIGLSLIGMAKGKALPPYRMVTGQPQFEAYFSVQTFMVFMPVSASVLVLNVPLSTTVVVVVAGFLSTTVHFLVEASRTT